MEIITVKNLKFQYPNRKQLAINDLSFTINQGEFIAIAGPSGCGKTTLLKLLKRELAPYGNESGEILYLQKPIQNASPFSIGYIMQNPENQIVTDTVWHELSFGLENIGLDKMTIRRRIAEVANFFGIEHWYRKNVDELSGGQKQTLNLASILAMQPSVLLLDEPTSQLDPIAASEFISTLKRINVEMGITVVLVEHRLEEVYQYVDKVMILDKGQIAAFDRPRNIKQAILEKNDKKLIEGLPTLMKIFMELDVDACPLSISEGKELITSFKNDQVLTLQNALPFTNNIIEIKDLWFRYEKNSLDILRGLTLNVFENEILAILGGNGAGKSTLLKVMTNLRKGYSGTVKILNKNINRYKHDLYQIVAYLPQNPEELFLKDNIKDDIMEMNKLVNLSKEEFERQMYEYALLLNLDKELFNSNPYDLSGGEMQKMALIKILMKKPKVILLDEPTKGMDAYSKQGFGEILKKLQEANITLVLVTHDIEFAASYANRAAMLFDGDIISIDEPHNFFTNNYYYTTIANRITRGHFESCIKPSEVVAICKLNGKKQ